MGVVALHVGGLAALQSGLLVRAYELVVPVEMISQIIEPPQPLAPPPAPAPAPAPTDQAQPKAASLPPAPQPLAIAENTPAPNAPAVIAVAPAPLPPIGAPVALAPSPAPVASPAPAPAPAPAPKIELPSSEVDYLNNPKPPYPPVSKRMGEQGRVMVRVYVGADGSALKVELNQSSGFDRLDATAVATVARWRFKPGTRGGVPEAMWRLVPIDFVIDN